MSQEMKICYIIMKVFKMPQLSPINLSSKMIVFQFIVKIEGFHVTRNEIFLHYNEIVQISSIIAH